MSVQSISQKNRKLNYVLYRIDLLFPAVIMKKDGLTAKYKRL
jgi:hypothetical protein